MKQASPSLRSLQRKEKVMDGHGMRSQERVAHFAQTSESGSEKVRVEQYISGQTFHPVPRQKKYGICFGNFSQHGGGVFPIPKTFVNLPSHFWYAKFISAGVKTTIFQVYKVHFLVQLCFRDLRNLHITSNWGYAPPMCGQCHLFAVLAVFKG